MNQKLYTTRVHTVQYVVVDVLFCVVGQVAVGKGSDGSIHLKVDFRRNIYHEN